MRHSLWWMDENVSLKLGVSEIHIALFWCLETMPNAKDGGNNGVWRVVAAEGVLQFFGMANEGDFLQQSALSIVVILDLSIIDVVDLCLIGKLTKIRLCKQHEARKQRLIIDIALASFHLGQSFSCMHGIGTKDCSCQCGVGGRCHYGRFSVNTSPAVVVQSMLSSKGLLLWL